ncbi:hypothetical protein [Consotaella aegiceratis]|uniref:hypothetical protein n=1 Tax=Consotaella aegiceratis TaxID=3097961 RepID=UPI002F402DA5
MSIQPSNNPQAVFNVGPGSMQALQIVATGEDIATMGRNVSIFKTEPEAETVDMVALFAAAVTHGFFGPSMTAEARLGSLEGATARWSLTTRGVPPEAFRVLANLLVLSDSASFTPADREIDTIAVASLPFPRTQQTPFEVDHMLPEQSGKERAVRIEFTAEPDVDAVLEALEVWCTLTILGGYRDALDHKEGGGFVEEPVWEGGGTFGIYLPILDCDEAVFDAVVTWASGFGSTTPVERIVIE